MPDTYQIVDENDQLVGHKLRDEIDFKTEYYRIAALWLTNSQGDVLIAQRLITKDKDPGKWGPAAAGTLEQGEDYESNMYKEAEEEIGLTGVEFATGEKLKFEEPRKAFCQIFIGECDWPDDKFIPQATEVEQVKWVPLQELIDDVSANPGNYVPSMKILIETVSK